MECISIIDCRDGLYDHDDFFHVFVDASPTKDYPHGGRIFGEFCLPEEAHLFPNSMMNTPESAKRLCRDRYASPEDLDRFNWED